MTAGGLRRTVSRWARAWGVPGLEDRVSITFSRRFRTSIGRYDSRRKAIRLAEWLLEPGGTLLEEALCHEAAHAALFELHGHRCRPHGPEWRALMLAAGFEPRVRVHAPELPVRPRPSTTPRWLHRCPACGSERRARRAMTAWRCLRCVKDGRSGRLEITSQPALSMRA